MTLRWINARLTTFALATFLAALPLPAAAQLSDAQIFEAAGIREGSTLCEIGAGAGDLANAAARFVGAKGRVFATELTQWLRTLQVRTENVPNITVVAGDVEKTNLEDASCDAIVMKDVYHHFTKPDAMNASILRALKPGARLVVVDFTPPPGVEAPTPAERGKDGMHGVRPATVARELVEAGFDVQPLKDHGSARWFVVIAVKKKDCATLAAPDSDRAIQACL